MCISSPACGLHLHPHQRPLRGASAAHHGMHRQPSQQRLNDPLRRQFRVDLQRGYTASVVMSSFVQYHTLRLMHKQHGLHRLQEHLTDGAAEQRTLCIGGCDAYRHHHQQEMQMMRMMRMMMMT